MDFLVIFPPPFKDNSKRPETSRTGSGSVSGEQVLRLTGWLPSAPSLAPIVVVPPHISASLVDNRLNLVQVAVEKVHLARRKLHPRTYFRPRFPLVHPRNDWH